MPNINMGMNIGMTVDMGMTFHTKQSNVSRPKQTRTTTTTTTSLSTSLSSSISTNTNLMFQTSMIDRVVKAKSGCSACGR